MPDPTNKHELILFSLKSCEAGEGTAYVKEYFFTSLIAEGRAILDLGCSNGCGTVALGEVAQNVTVITREKETARISIIHDLLELAMAVWYPTATMARTRRA